MWILPPLLVVILTVSCNDRRISALEKRVLELQSEVQRRKRTPDLQKQQICADAAKQWFAENSGKDKRTLFLNYVNHYNAKDERCFIGSARESDEVADCRGFRNLGSTDGIRWLSHHPSVTPLAR